MGVLDFERALAVVLEQAAQLGDSARKHPLETIGLLAAQGRVLASAVCADRDQPPFDRATRDGFAVSARHGDQVRSVVGQVRAGQSWAGTPLAAGEALQIMTGAPMPAGADAVVMVEHTTLAGQQLSLTAGHTPAAGDNLVKAGAEARRGDTLLHPGRVVGASEIALTAACGAAALEVYRRPAVAIVATGDELVELDRIPAAEQIRNSNSYALAAMVASAGATPVRLAIAPDTLAGVRARLAEGRRSDLLVLSGGVSMGEYDLVEQVLAEAGAEFFFTGVRMQPGKPVVFGRLPATDEDDACYFFGLPGNPISTQVTFLCFVEPLLRALAGVPAAGPRFTLATLSEVQAARPGVTRLLPGKRVGTEVGVVGWQGSGDQAANARADCYVELKAGIGYTAGQTVRILLR